MTDPVPASLPAPPYYAVVFTAVRTAGDNGYVSFELDPLLDDAKSTRAHQERVSQYIELGRKWSAGHRNRMIKVPATEGGIAASRNWPRQESR